MPPTWTVLTLGFGLGLSLAAPPGPILALCAHRTVHRGFLQGLVVPLGAMVGDGTYALIMGAGLLPLVARVAFLDMLLAIVGGAMLLLFAWMAWQAARRPAPLEAQAPADAPRWSGLAGGFATGYVLALTSPFNFGWWLSAGTTLFGDYGTLVFVGFFAGLLAWTLFFVVLVWWTSGRIKGVVTFVSYASAALLAAFGAYILARGVMQLAGQV